MGKLILGLVLIFSGCSTPQVVYRCPEGQVLMLENGGTPHAVKRCYTPFVSYTDYRPITTEAINEDTV